MIVYIQRFHLPVFLLIALLFVGCQSPKGARKSMDKRAAKIIEAKQEEALGRVEPFTIETSENSFRRMLLGEQNLPVSGPASFGTDKMAPHEKAPEKDYPARTDEFPPIERITFEKPTLTLVEALMVGARNSRNYQTEKEKVFKAALDLEAQIDAFRASYTGMLESLFSSDQTKPFVTGMEHEGSLGLGAKLKTGATLSTKIIFDLAHLISNQGASSIGIAGDMTVTIPLLKGAGKLVVKEPLTQAERNVVYAIWNFERFKRSYAVTVVRQYYNVLQARDQVANAEDNYKTQIKSTRRTRALSEEGRMRQESLDQALQSELRVRNTWIRAQENYESTLDNFKLQLGLPTDAVVEVDAGELISLKKLLKKRMNLALPDTLHGKSDSEIVLPEPDETAKGPYEFEEGEAVSLALANRLDLKVKIEQALDAQRHVSVAANALKAGLDLTANAAVGGSRSLKTVGSVDQDLDPGKGVYTAGVLLDLPIERTDEKVALRKEYIDWEVAVRNVQELEDTIKQEVRNQLRSMISEREGFAIQLESVQVAKRRVDRTQAFLDLGRASVSTRDVNEAQADLLRAQNAVTAALIDYRLSELELQRDLGLLSVNDKGLYKEMEYRNAFKN